MPSGLLPHEMRALHKVYAMLNRMAHNQPIAQALVARLFYVDALLSEVKNDMRSEGFLLRQFNAMMEDERGDFLRAILSDEMVNEMITEIVDEKVADKVEEVVADTVQETLDEKFAAHEGEVDKKIEDLINEKFEGMNVTVFMTPSKIPDADVQPFGMLRHDSLGNAPVVGFKRARSDGSSSSASSV